MVFGILGAQFLKRIPTQQDQVYYDGNKETKLALKEEPEGLSYKEAVNSWQFWIVITIFFCLGFCYLAIVVHIVPHITDLGISATNAVNILATMGGISIIGNIVLGGIGDRIGNKLVCIISFILMAASLLWLISVKDVAMFYLCTMIFSFAVGGCTTTESPIVAIIFGLKSHGLLLGIVSFCFTIGAALGPVVTGYIFDLTGSYQVAFLILVFAGVVGLISSIVLRPTKRLGGRI